jgi:hypothetical protein
MNPVKVIGMILLAAGALGLLYGGFSYTQDTTALKVGPLEVKVQEKKTVNVPLWAGVGAMVAGALVLGFASKGKG